MTGLDRRDEVWRFVYREADQAIRRSIPPDVEVDPRRGVMGSVGSISSGVCTGINTAVRQ